MKKVFTLIALFLFIDSFAQGEYIVEINRTNGNFNKITSAIPGITYVYANVRAYNETNGTFIFQGGMISPDYLYSIDVTNGSVISNPPFTFVDGKEFEFDNSTGTLYGLFFDTGLSQYFLETITPTTGVHVNVSTSPIPNMGICQGCSTFDEINNKYLLKGNNNILSIDATTGIISSNTALGLLSGEVLVGASLSYDNSTGILYGLLWDSNITNKYFLVSINPSTGTVTKIGSGTTLLEQGGSAIIDKVNQQYIYLYSSVSAGGWEIATIDIATGNVIYNALIAPFNANDNFYSLEYDNIQGKLYAIHWETNSTGISEQNHLNNFINIYPNPFSTQTTLQIDPVGNLSNGAGNPLHNATLTVYNCFGQAVKSLVISHSPFVIERGNLPSGLYFIRLMQDNKTIATEKLVITDK
ncbi:MAG: T9SS type A sorting domain-containing protein [Bacteroidetes bacterium]|nr:T9SS type A sorting domain-containing protein [Bacteroidota bacterium]